MEKDVAQPGGYLRSPRWIAFVESMAQSLQASLTLLLPEGTPYLKAPRECPACHFSLSGLAPVDLKGKAGEGNALEADTVVLPLLDGLFMAVHDCRSKLQLGTALPLRERAVMAQSLLNSFGATLMDSLDSGRSAVELTALRQANRIIVSLFQGDGKAVDRALDLVLSSLIILYDGQTSWVEYGEKNRPALQVKGDRDLLNLYFHGLTDTPAAVVEAQAQNISLRMGVLGPGRPVQSEAVLGQMANEVLIVLGIERLFRLLEGKMRQVLGAVNSALLLIDRNQKINFANNAAQQLLMSPILTLIGSGAETVQGPWSSSLLEATANYVHGEKDLLVKGDDARLVDWKVHPLKENQILMGWLVIIEDRTDYYKWQEACRRSERFAVTSSMIGALAHELRNPLAAARGLLQLVGRRQDPKQAAGYLDLITKELDRVTVLLNEFLLIGKPAKITPEPTDIRQFLSELLPLLESEALAAGVDFRAELAEVPPSLIDSGQLTQVILNLVRNAVESVGENGQIQITLRHSGKDILLEVMDNGPGLAPEAVEKLFEPFFTTKATGTGLGLPISRAIINNHGGEISASNLQEGGALFRISLPAFPQGGAKVTSIDVLAVLSDEETRCYCEQSLRSVGYRTVAVPSLAEAQFPKDCYQPEIIILDQKNCINKGSGEKICLDWPQSRIMVLGEPSGNSPNGRIEFLRPPLDCVNLIERIHSFLGRP